MLSALTGRVGVVGLGLMGTAIAQRLIESHLRPYVWNRTQEKAASLIASGAVWSDCPPCDCEIVIISLFSSDVVDEVLQRWQHSFRRGLIVIDTTTGRPEDSERFAEWLRQKGAIYLDAPISGSSEQTRRGEATVIVSGNEDAFKALTGIWPILGRNFFFAGKSGNAARMKLVSNLVLGLNRAALAEGLTLAEGMGISPGSALEILRGSPAYSRQMDTKGHKMIQRDYTVQAKLSQHMKDVRLMLEAAERLTLSLPLTNTHLQLLQRAESLGYGNVDNSAVREAYRQ
ncbi:MAG: NAD(P)-dependent oxidoreductase [Planctomycetaceae bacterium]|nr:NAD(P)-dependent oxidoreductase [Planctomycetaceae bacterium]